MRRILPALIVLLTLGLLWHHFGGHQADPGGDGHVAKSTEREAPILAPTTRPPGSTSSAASNADSSGPRPAGSRPGAGPVTVTVLDTEGHPIPNAAVFLQRGTRQRGGHAAEDGRVTFQDIDLHQRWDLQAWGSTMHSGFLEREWLPRDRTIELERALKISGRVVDEDGLPATDYRVRYRYEDGPPAEVARARLDKQASFEFSVRAGSIVLLWVHYEAYQARLLPGDFPLALPPQPVQAGTRDLVLQVFRGGIIHVECSEGQFDSGTQLIDAGPRAPSSVLTSESTGRTFRGVVDLGGHAVFAGLPAEGPWHLSILGTQGESYVDRAGLRSSRKVQRVRGKPGETITGTLDLPPGVPAHRVVVWAENPTLGAARGHVDSTSRTFRIRGLPLGQTWTVHAAGLADGALGTQPSHRAQASARIGQEVLLSLK